MLYSEFLHGINYSRKATDGTLYAYEVINRMYMEDKLNTHEECYNYFDIHKDEFLFIDNPLYIGNKRYIERPENLTTAIDDKRAIEIIAEEFCFDKSKIEICGQAYFDAWDFNFIIFKTLKDDVYLMKDSELYQVWL